MVKQSAKMQDHFANLKGIQRTFVSGQYQQDFSIVGLQHVSCNTLPFDGTKNRFQDELPGRDNTTHITVCGAHVGVPFARVTRAILRVQR
eukprot:3732644-Amphidinium_carterae.1